MVWDDEIEISLDDPLSNLNGPLSASPELSVAPPPPRPRSQSAAGDFPPPIRRTSTDASGVFRPVPFSAKFQKVHPGTTGVTLLEHLERLDAVEASLQRLGLNDSVIEEEIDVGESSSSKQQPLPISNDTSTSHLALAGSPESLSPVMDPEVGVMSDLEASMTEEDLVAMSKSTSHVEVSPTLHRGKWSSRARRNEAGRGLDFLREDEAPKRKVIVEVGLCRFSIPRAVTATGAQRLETITRKPLCSCW
jgi:phosphatidylinositol 4-kinase type 2